MNSFHSSPTGRATSSSPSFCIAGPHRNVDTTQGLEPPIGLASSPKLPHDPQLVNIPSPTPPLPPRPAPAEELVTPTIELPAGSRSRAFSDSDTAEEGGSSPVLPPLPRPTHRINGEVLNLDSTPPRERSERAGSVTEGSASQDGRSEVSRYFTSWGSPIGAGTSAGNSEGQPEEEGSKGSEEEEDIEPLRRLNFSGQTPFLRPPPSFLRSHTEPKAEPISASVLANRARRGLPSRGLTEDWIRQHTEAGVSEVERLAWLSDNEKEEEEQGYSSLSSSEADLEEYKLEFGQKTPTLKSFLERKDRLGTHSRFQSIETVRPGDLRVKKGGKSSRVGSRKVSAALSMTSNGTYDTAQQSLAESKEDDAWGMERKSPTLSSADKPLPDKPLPIPPMDEETEAEKPNKRWSAAALPNIPTFEVTSTDEKPHAELPTAPELPELPKTRTPSPMPRVKKKVPWGRKNISVLLPLDEDRGQPGSAPRPLSQREASQMFESWKQLGYNIDGYDLNLSEEGNDAAVYGQSRDMWPAMPDVLRERAERQFRVSIPDRSQWDAYVQDLQEAKLRALGVSLGDEDENLAPTPLYPPVLSRVASGQYPPLTASATSNKSGMFSSPIPGAPTGPSSFAGSSASVAQKMLGKLHTSHQSMSFNNSEHPFGSPFSQQQSPVAWSPQNMLYQNMRDRSASVSYGAFSPSSPMNMTPNGMQQDGYFPNTQDASAIQRIQRERTHSLINQSPFGNQFNQPILRQSPRLQELSIHDGMTTPGSQHFMPQHKQNLSDGLQKEIEDAEYHLEEQIERQLEHDDYSPHSEKGFHMGIPIPQVPPGFEGLHHPQPHSRGHSLSQRQFGPDSSALQGFDPQHLGHLSEVNSTMNSGMHGAMHSGANTPSHMITPSMAQNPWTDEPGRIENQRPSHQSKPSLSKLNVAAKPFVFNPGKTAEFKPVTKLNPAATFTPGKPAFEFPASNPLNAYAAALPVSPELQRAKAAVEVTTPKQSTTSPVQQFGSGKINAAAPEFTPGGSKFSFSSRVRPDAPEFKPMFSDSGSGGDEPSVRTSIFGKIIPKDVEGKKSKAIPIVKPVSRDGIDHKEEKTVYDKDGRVGQPEGRFKRMKDNSESGDEVPQFAEPSPAPKEVMPLQEITRQQSPVKGQSPAQNKPVDKENADPSGDENGAPAPLSPPKMLSKKTMSFADIPDYEGNDWAPVDWTSQLESGNSKKHSQSGTPFEIHDEEATFTAEKAATPVSSSNDDHKKHKKNSLSALAKPFQFGQPWNETEKSDAPVSAVKAKTPSIPGSSPTMTKRGLQASRWADPSPSASPDALSEAEAEQLGDTEPLGDTEDEQDAEVNEIISSVEEDPAMAELADEDTCVSELEEGEIRESNPPSAHQSESERGEPTFEDIDDVMRYMNEDPNIGMIRHTMETPTWRDEAPSLTLEMPHTGPSPIRLDPYHRMRSDAPSPSPGRRYQTSSLGDFDGHNDFSRGHDDPFGSRSPLAMQYAHSPIHHLNDPALSVEPSDWDSVLEEDDEAKFEARSQFFDSHVNDIVGGILAEKLDPIERVLETVQQSLAVIGLSQASSRRDRRSTSAEIQESDADDEDDEEDPRPIRRDMSPMKKDRAPQVNMEQIRAVILDAFAAQHSRPQTREDGHISEEVLLAIHELREQVEETKLQTQKHLERNEETAASAGVMAAIGVLAAKVERSLDPDFQGERLRNVVEDVAERRIQHASGDKISDLEKQLAEMKDKVKASEANTEREILARRQAEDSDAKAQRLLRLSRVEEQRVREELEEKEKKISVLEQTVGSRYSAEDEVRLREAIQQKDEKIMDLEEARSKSANHAKVMEVTAQNTQRMLGELEDRIVELDRELSDARQETREWKFETQKAHEITEVKRTEANEAVAEATALRRTVESLRLQMQESLRVRETFRVKLGQLQERMAAASHEVNQEDAQRAKKEATLLARQDVLDARLEAEAATRDRMMKEIERLEAGEREAFRAVNDNKKLQAVVYELENKLNEAEKRVLRYKREFEAEREANVAEVGRTKTFMQVEIEMAKADLIEAQEEAEKYRLEFEEARESGLSEVGRTKMYMQAEIEAANNQVNIVRQELEDQVLSLRAEVDHVKMEADTARERHEMLLEDAVVNSEKEIAELRRQHEDKVEDIQTQHERSLGNAIEDAQRAEQHLLERLSLSSAKTDHLQDRVSHLEEKLELAKEAAAAAVSHAKNSRGNVPYPSDTSMPEKISPQALRESIMVLQEQLQNREETIEKLEHQLEDVDPDAQNTILKQKSEINWLRELLEVRKGDLQDIIDIAESPNFNKLGVEAVKGAAIRLKANLQMEELERERAENGSGGLNLPNIASSIREAATPRVAQVSGVLSTAWGNWRKSATNGLSETHTPSRIASPSIVGGASSFLSGFMTPPISSVKGKEPMRPAMAPTKSSDERRVLEHRDDRRLKGGFGASFDHTSGHQNAAQKARQQSRDDRDALRESERPSPRMEMGRSRGTGRMGSLSSLSSVTGRSERERHAPRDRYATSERSGSTVQGHQGENGELRMPQTPPMMRTESYDRDAREEDYSDAGFYDDDESTVDEAMFGASLGR